MARRRDGGIVPDDYDPYLRSLVEDLIRRSESATGPDEILLDMEVDGIRCVLMRIPAQENRTRNALSPRELEICRMIAKGYPNKIIADILEISTWTVNTHLRRIFAKLGVTSRTAMVAKLLEEGGLGDVPAASRAPVRRTSQDRLA